MRPLLVLALLIPLVGLLAGSERPKSRPLDLPSGGRGSEEDEEDGPETIQFFGSAYEGDGFFFLLDKSGSMYGAKMELLKAEMSSALDELSEGSEFGIVAFSGDTLVYSPVPQPATPSNVGLAQAWVNALVAYGPTMMLSGAGEILTIAQISSRENRSVIAVGDGLPNGPGPAETLAGILQLNYENLPFHTILFGSEAEAVQFMSDLASSTGGTFRAGI